MRISITEHHTKDKTLFYIREIPSKPGRTYESTALTWDSAHWVVNNMDTVKDNTVTGTAFENNPEFLLVGGTFDEHGGKPSYIVSSLAKTLCWDYVNGGSLEQLKKINFNFLKVLIWMPNIDNSEDKILPTIKKINQKLLLIQSKRLIEKDYSPNDMVGRLLQSHSALGIMISKSDNGYGFKVLDPLGNIWIDTNNPKLLAETLKSRIEEILEMKRVGSESVGPKNEFELDSEFIKIIQSYGTEFTKFVNAVNPNRLLGNASTRCSRGFPGVRVKSRLFVTRRNVDKQTLSNDDFVEILSDEDKVKFYGDIKPSVDTPIQIRLFNYYKNVNYMLHGHVYVQGGLMTAHKTPCGFLNEFDEIVKLFPDPNSTNFVVNLRGHGCLIMSKNLKFFKNQTLVGRPFPENVENTPEFEESLATSKKPKSILSIIMNLFKKV